MSLRVKTSPLCKHNSGRNKDVIFLHFEGPEVQKQAGGPAQLGVWILESFLAMTLALPIVLHVHSSAPRTACQGSSAWPQHTSVGSLEYILIP